MPKIFNTGNPNFKSPNTCSPLSPLPANLLDTTFKTCEPNEEMPCVDFGNRKRIGEKANCDPMQSGQIINSVVGEPNRTVINRYSNALRGCDQAMTDLFKELVVIDPDGRAWPIPIMYGTQEKAVATILQNNVRKDNTLVVDRPPLPFLSIYPSNIAYARERYIYHKALLRLKEVQGQKPADGELLERDTIFGIARGIPVDVTYTLIAWTRYIEDMNQILEQVFLKFSPMAYIKIQNVPWEIGVALDSITNSIDYEPGDKNVRVVKYQFNLTAQAYIPQPIIRNKTVLRIRTDFFNSVDPEKMDHVYGRTEIGTKDV